MSDRKRKELTDEALAKVSGGYDISTQMGGANCTGVAIMQWCDVCQANTPHNANGQCMTCKQSDSGDSAIAAAQKA